MDDNSFLNQSNNQSNQSNEPNGLTTDGMSSRPQFTSRYSNRPEYQSGSESEPETSPMSLSSSKPRGRMRPAAAGAIGTICGLAVGAAGIYGLIKLTEQPPECPECKCDNQPTRLSTNDLNYDFLKLEATGDNIVYSPLSIRNGLALLDAGASGTTKTEIESVLGTEEIPKYENIPDKLSLANAVFIKNTFQNEVLPSYTETVQNDYNSEVLYDDFASSDNMDNWVKQKTFNLINSIGIQPDENLRMVLANALAIQMDWKYKLDTDETTGGPFYTKDGSEIEATTMRKEAAIEDIKYYKDDNTTVVSMPLDSTSENANLDFLAVMPSGDIDEYIGNIDQSQIDEIVNNLTPASEPKDGVILTIPKFKFDYALNFKSDLETLGIKAAFNNQTADFSNMATEPLYVSDAVHKANIDFSEDGIKAAAVTAFAMDIKSALEEEEPQPVIINIDHPFVFLIRDNDNGTVWFTGAVYQPNLWADDSAEYEEGSLED